MAHFNPSVFHALLEARNLTVGAIANRLERTATDLNEQLNAEDGPKRGTLNAIARELAVPPFVFYMDSAPSLARVIPDFRSERPVVSRNSRETIEAIDIANRVQQIAIESGARCSLNIDGNLTQFNVAAFAASARKALGISYADQNNAKDAREFYYFCRQRIEQHGVFVLQKSFPSKDGSGFCLADETAPVIVINSRDQNPSRRLFTLLHEFAHVILALSGISDPFIRRNPTETLCNKFAAAFLLPKSLCLEAAQKFGISQALDRDRIASAARKLKASQQATVLRFEQLEILSQGSYKSWLALVRATGNPDYINVGFGSGTRPPEEKFKIARYGFYFAKVFSRAISSGQISPLDLYRASGLKPKWQQPLFALASTASPADMED